MTEPQANRPPAAAHGVTHPNDPRLLAVAIGAWTASLALDALGRVGASTSPFPVALPARALLGLGIVAALAAAAVGLAGILAARRPGDLAAPLLAVGLNVVVAVGFAGKLLGDLGEPSPAWASALFAAAIGIVALGDRLAARIGRAAGRSSIAAVPTGPGLPVRSLTRSA